MKQIPSFLKCGGVFAIFTLCMVTISMAAQPEEQPMLTDSKMEAAESSCLEEMGLMMSFGPALSWFTNDKFDNKKVAVGMFATAMLYMRFNHFFGINNGIYFGQYGSRYKYDSQVFQSTINTLGVISLATFYLAGRIEPSLGVGFLLGANACGVNRHKFDGDKHRDKINFSDNDNRFFAAFVVSMMVTARTNIGDFGTGVRVSTGLTSLQKDPIERKVPILMDIPLTYTLFSRKKNNERIESIIIIKPRIAPTLED